MASNNPGPASVATANDPLAKQSDVAAQILAASPTRGLIASTSARRQRTIYVGDSHLGMGFSRASINTTGGMVVAGGIATITTTGNHGAIPGNYVALSHVNDPTFSQPLNGACVPVASMASNSVFTVSATVGGVTMPPGDYSSQAWTLYKINQYTDSSVINWVNYYNKTPFLPIASYAFVGFTSAQTLAALPKVFQGPAFDIAFVSLGTNDLGGGGAITLPNALIAAALCFDNIKQIANQLVAAGAFVYILVPPAFLTSITNAQNKNIALLQLRAELLLYANQNNGSMKVIDLLKDSLIGTAANGDAVANYIVGGNVHLTSFADLAIAKNESAIVPTVFNDTSEPISILEDHATIAQQVAAWTANTAFVAPTVVRNNGNYYSLVQSGGSGNVGPSGTGSAIQDGTCIWKFLFPYPVNLVPHGMMDGTTGTNSVGAAVTGNIPTGWTFVSLTASSTATSAGQQTRQTVTNSNATNWGYGWNINITWDAAARAAVLRSSLFTGAMLTGQWYRAGITVTALADVTGTSNIALEMQFSAITPGPALVHANIPADNTTTVNMKSGDSLQLWTPPFQVPDSWVSNGSFLNIYLNSQAAGTCNVQLASAVVRPIPNPYA